MTSICSRVHTAPRSMLYMCVYICIYICICMHIYVYINIYMHTCICIYIYIYIHVCVYMYVYTYTMITICIRHVYMCIYTQTYTCIHICIRPTQSIIYVPLLVNRFQKTILLIVQYTFLKSCSTNFILQNLILRTRSCGTGFITQSSWVLHFRPTFMVGQKCFETQLYHHLGGGSPRGTSSDGAILGGPAFQYFCSIYRVGKFIQNLD